MNESTDDSLVLVTHKDHVTTLTMNMPRRYNGWTQAMMTELRGALKAAGKDAATGAIVLTGVDPYYCAGVNLAGTLKLDHPRRLHAMIAAQNAALFDMFLDVPKPILVAANGPAIGAAVTTATLCDGIIASERATFATPFARLGVPFEGCSSLVFPAEFGEEVTGRMIGKEGWVPTAKEAAEFGMVQKVVAHEDLLKEAQKIAKGWAKKGKAREYPAGATKEELKAVNARESEAVADAFLSPAFLEGQFKFLLSRKKHGPAAMFFLLWKTHPVWSLLLPKAQDSQT